VWIKYSFTCQVNCTLENLIVFLLIMWMHSGMFLMEDYKSSYYFLVVEFKDQLWMYLAQIRLSVLCMSASPVGTRRSRLSSVSMWQSVLSFGMAATNTKPNPSYYSFIHLIRLTWEIELSTACILPTFLHDATKWYGMCIHLLAYSSWCLAVSDHRCYVRSSDLLASCTRSPETPC
jgi:hypothetical protein